MKLYFNFCAGSWKWKVQECWTQGTNKLLPQLSLGMFYTPSEDAVIGPIEDLINEGHFPKYRNYIFKEYMEEFYRQEGKRRRVKEIRRCDLC